MAYAALIMAAAQVGYGIYQNQKAKKKLAEAEANKPVYQIPKSVRDNLSEAQVRAMEGLPEEQRKEFITQIQRSSNDAINRTADRRSGLAGLSGVYQQEMDAYRQLFNQDVVARQNNQQEVMRQRSIMGNYEDKQFQVNQLNPYNNAVNQANAMQGAGTQNMMAGARTAVGSMEQNAYNEKVYKAGQPNTQQINLDNNMDANGVNLSTYTSPQANNVNPNGLIENQYVVPTTNGNQLGQGQEFVFTPNSYNY